MSVEPRGTRFRPYPTPQVLFEFLMNDAPGEYVFRGQTQEYSGPLLPSGIRDSFRPVPEGARRTWAGVNRHRDVANLHHRRRDELPPSHDGRVMPEDGKRVWEITEAQYQAGFRTFFNQPSTTFHRGLGAVLRGGSNLGLSDLLGSDLSDALCQHYGMTSLQLDTSTDPRVALFFATHESPYYDPVVVSEDLGVVYRWPRRYALIAEDILVALEQDSFVDTMTSLRRYIELNPSLSAYAAGRHRVGELERRCLTVFAEDGERDVSALVFPRGAYEQSRMGRQGAALLRPHYKVFPISPTDMLVGDLMTTHAGEAFFFRHTCEIGFLDQLDKFALWPSLKAASIRISKAPDGDDRILVERLQLEDVYLEFLLRFFSTCSPIQVSVFSVTSEPMLEHPTIPFPGRSGAARRYLQSLGFANGVIDLGFRMHAGEARVLANRLGECSRTEHGSDASMAAQADDSAVRVAFARYVAPEDVHDFQRELYRAFASIALP